jgi:hypothetical protein
MDTTSQDAGFQQPDAGQEAPVEIESGSPGLCGLPDTDLVLEDTPGGGAAERKTAHNGKWEAAPAEPDLRTPVRQVVGVLEMNSGKLLEAVFFVHLAALHGGPERLLDRLNGPDRFLPVQTEEGLALVNTGQIARVSVSCTELEPSATDARWVPVRVHLTTGTELTGRVRIEGPPGRRRLSDQLNAQPGFVAVESADQAHLVHTSLIARLVPLHPNAQPQTAGDDRE